MSRTRIAAATATIGLLVAGGAALALTPVEEPVTPLPTLASARSSGTAGPSTTPLTTTPSTSTVSPTPAPTPALTADEAAAIALRHTGGGRVTEIERETEHGRAEWKVEIVTGGVERDVRVDATTGTITRDETDRGRDDDRGGDDRGGDDRGGDDDRGHDAGDDHGGDRSDD